jgi:hypothetical protein
VTVTELLFRLDGVRSRGPGKWLGKCPSHEDKSPSLSIAEGADGRILLHDFAGCSPLDIVASLNLELKDLFTDAPNPHGHRMTPRPVKIDRVALAFRFELAALDRRLRAERVLQAVKSISINELPDHDLDRLVDVAACAYVDIERAELFEGVADGLKAKTFAQQKGQVNDAA